MYAFWLGREFKLSLAEIHQCFPKTEIEYISKNICILNTQNKAEILKKAAYMWGTIKIIELIEWYRGKPEYSILDIGETHEWKFAYGLTILGSDKPLKTILIDTKKVLKAKWLSSRFVNKNFQNLTSAQIIGENLVERGSDFTLMLAWKTEYFGKTVWVQDIEAYSKRDYGKARDMQVGMLPPKLSQMMINISEGDKIYDPFCGLWTILIESILKWDSEVYGSDISAENIEKTKKNINFARKEFDNNIKTAITQVLDAKWISSSPFLKKSNAIVTEWYLGQVFHKHSISEAKIDIEKQILLDIYTKFFSWLQRANYTGIVVICFPFWEVRGKYYYFSEAYELIKKYSKNLPMLPRHDEFKHTKSWSLLYKRPDQVVWREIFKLKIR
jgi:tRNA G10  N-methylase Trm11